MRGQLRSPFASAGAGLFLLLMLLISCSGLGPGEGWAQSEDGPRVVHLYLKVPAKAKVVEYVTDGIDAAAKGTELWEVEGVRRWIAAEKKGLPFSTRTTGPLLEGSTGASEGLQEADARLYLVVLIRPQFTATVAGWQAAQDEATWQRIQQDKAAVAAEVADRVLKGWKWQNRAGIEEVVAVGAKRTRVEASDSYRGHEYAIDVFDGELWWTAYYTEFRGITARDYARAVRTGRAKRARGQYWPAEDAILDEDMFEYLLEQAEHKPDLRYLEEVETAGVVYVMSPDLSLEGPLPGTMSPRPKLKRGAMRVVVGTKAKVAYADFE
jgi:hypothetical protein